MHLLLILLLFLLMPAAVLAQPVQTPVPVPAAEVSADWLPALTGKRLGLVVNATSRVGNQQHLVDFLRQQPLTVARIFAPEHGFRGEADAGAQLVDGVDTATGLPVVSLYGAHKKPSPSQLADLDVLVFDIQDVGVRYYTYISTLHYLLEAAAEAGKPVFVLDRPNPNGALVDGPVLDMAFSSFVGKHPIPLLHGLTVAELARMIQGEGWIQDADKLRLTVVPIRHYRHDMPYSLPVRPSPNLPNDQSIRLYPSLGLFEGTPVSVGRGTEWPFQVLGWPLDGAGTFAFTPRSRPGATAPPYQDQRCQGLDLRSEAPAGLSLKYLLHFYRARPAAQAFFNPFFDKLAGTDQLRTQIEAGWDETQIR
ncbi:MAG: DUF1343 domain-containing protein, partial [Candidatus Melainabacteria bacterium HGW-Melainabacteria-1]